MKSFSFFFLGFLIVFLTGCKEDDPVAPTPVNLSPPANVQIELETGGVIKLSWEIKSSGHDGFYVERKVENGNYIVIGTATKDVTVFRDNSTKSADSVYFYRIYAFSGKESGEYSTETSINLNFPPPSNVGISSADNSSINLTWTDNSTIELGYQIERKTGTDLYQSIGRVEAGVTSYSDTSMLMGETTYDYRVKAYAEKFLSSPSNTLSVTTGFPAPNFTLNIASEEQIIFDWDEVPGAEYYFIFMKDTANNYLKLDSIPAGNTSYEYNTLLKVNQNYTFSMQAESNRRISKISEDVTGMLEFKAPDLSIDQINGEIVQLSWLDNTTFEERFELQRKEGILEYANVDSNIAANITTYIDNFAVDTNVTYTYRLRAVSPKGNVSPYSIDSITLTFTSAINLSIKSRGENSVTLQWNNNGMPQSNLIVEKTNLITDEKSTYKLDPGAEIYIAENLDKNFIYQYRVRIVTGKNVSVYSNAVKVDWAGTSKMK